MKGHNNEIKLQPRVEESRQNTSRSTQSRCPQSCHVGRPLETSCAQYDQCVADPEESPGGGIDWQHPSPTFEETRHLDAATANAHRQLSGQGKGTASRNLGCLGGSPSPEAVPVCGQEGPDLRLRTSELVRMLNSTPLGTVIDERQLYRHRQRSGGRFFQGGRNCLFAYVGWLIEERHQQQKKRGGADTESVNLDTVLRLLDDQDYCCALSGTELTPTTTALDHIQPVSRGGEHVITNAQAVTKDINRAKGTMTNEEFVDMCRSVVRWHDGS